MAPDVMWVHEDEEGLRCLWPIAAAAHLARDIAASAAAEERNRDPGGGYSDMYAVQQPPHDLADEGILRDDLLAHLDGIMPRWRSFVVGDGDLYGYRDDDALCFGFDNQCFLYAFSREGVVTSIWFNAWTDDPAQLAALRRAIEAVDGVCRVALVDYWLKCTGAVADPAFLDSYFGALARHTETLTPMDEIRTASRHDTD